jgi:uncharacterized integral membrane protein
MRLGILLPALAFVVLGALFGAFNAQGILLDFYFGVITVPAGAALLAALLVGWILGGLVAWLARVPRLKRQLREAQRALRAAEAAPRAIDDA